MARLEYYRAYDIQRAKLPHRRENAKRVLAAWRKANPEKASRYRRENPAKYRAQTAVGNALRDGLMIKPLNCHRCKTPDRIEAHHVDYSKPLDVEWLCKPCHAKADQERRAA